MRVRFSLPAQIKNVSLSYIEISKKNLIFNIRQFKNILKKNILIVSVVKANAYHYGDKEVTRIIDKYTDYFQVDSIEELERIKKIVSKPILVFGYLNDDGIKRAILSGLIISSFDFLYLLRINKIAKSLNKKVKVIGLYGMWPS